MFWFFILVIVDIFVAFYLCNKVKRKRLPDLREILLSAILVSFLIFFIIPVSVDSIDLSWSEFIYGLSLSNPKGSGLVIYGALTAIGMAIALIPSSLVIFVCQKRMKK